MASRSSPAYSPLPTRPLSPWAQRYQYNTGGRHPLIEDEEIHSGIAPELPRLHPKYYADAPSRDTLNPTKLQLDTLFLTEAFQRNYFRGLESWQNATFMRYVWFSNQSGILSGGHREADYGPVDGSMAVDPTNITGSLVNEKKEDIALKIFHSERIQVDETKWFTFLKKDRWYDTVKPVPVLGGANWSVDNPKVWEVLSISLELVDRILKALLADRHVMIEAILFGLIARWDEVSDRPAPWPDANVLLTRPYYKEFCSSQKKPCALDDIARFSTAVWTIRFETLMKALTYGFVDRFEDSSSTWGATIHHLRAMIVVDVNIIKNLMGNQITLAERCLLQFILAVTVVDFDAANEMGFAAEQRIFGGELYIGPLNCNDIPFGAYRMNWPEPLMTPTENVDTSHPSVAFGAKIITARIPALYASKLLSAAFWSDPTIPMKSENHFHFNALMITEATFRGDVLNQHFDPCSPAGELPARLQPGELEMMRGWNEQLQNWLTLRDGWYKPSQAQWQDSSWSYYKNRGSILAFGSAFARKDEITCAQIARNFLYKAAWNRGERGYIASLPRHDRPNHEWVFHAIGCLMSAALPIRRDVLTNEKTTPEAMVFFVPSREAQAKNREPKTYVGRERLKQEETAEPSELYDPLCREAEDEIAAFRQEDYLDLVASLLHHLSGLDIPISAPWLREISRTAEDLRRQRRDTRRGTHRESSWATWRFVVPAYNNTMSKFQDGRWAVQM
ncbi:hypothetical protein F4823DRAFT_632869 [Ustulina deusta]|nr:hypothetical protein F4823DRAFT_632869 [Ustulina deusta]